MPQGLTGFPAGIVVHRRDLRTDWSDALVHSLSDVERRRAERFARDGDRRRFVLGRHLVRSLFGGRRGCPPQDVPIRIDAKGRPHVIDAPSFSLSHAEDQVVLAIAARPPGKREITVGIDIEAVRTDVDPQALGRHMLADEELRWLRDAPDRNAMFFRSWTAKEAALKAAGQGLLADPRTVCIDVRGDRPTIVRAPARFHLRGCVFLPAPPHHVAALAWCTGEGVC